VQQLSQLSHLPRPILSLVFSPTRSTLYTNMPHSLSRTDKQTGNNPTPPRRRGVYLLTHPRSASNLFLRMMSKQRSHGVDVRSSAYHFWSATFPMLGQMGKGSLRNWTETEREALYGPYKESFDKMNRELANAEKEVI
jgi:hypothetical protein